MIQRMRTRAEKEEQAAKKNRLQTRTGCKEEQAAKKNRLQRRTGCKEEQDAKKNRMQRRTGCKEEQDKNSREETYIMSTRFDNRQAILLDQLLDDPNLSPTPALLLNDKTLSLWLQDKIFACISMMHMSERLRSNVPKKSVATTSAATLQVKLRPGLAKWNLLVLETGWLILLQVLHLNQGNYRDGVLEKIIGQQLLALNNFQREMGTRKIMSKGDVDFMKELFGELGIIREQGLDGQGAASMCLSLAWARECCASVNCVDLSGGDMGENVR
ncbi:uncharacterized protein J4E84_006742 [Alternaria hordeiaustralica]|uniref:uncharacterized protein n=1 Tax=Alternaria hordeiaustralica TaxID=1187925 RepID=UPI0020C4F810|nr:uncharacterized protein J4E84_006742 [Alternaria hordeiaustralica]KAI4683902.1 hypothetical protein J4E84_006742 [Alternaria hordeiaustralica]